MKPRTQQSPKRLVLIVGLVALIIGMAWYTFPERNQTPTQTFAATIQRDCAPWDGAAFTVTIPLQNGDAIVVSIWQAPEFNHPKTFSFPDDSGPVGNASLMHPGGLPEQLRGKVFVSSVQQGSPTEGRFELSMETGQHFVGEFQAKWDDQIVLCG